MKEEKKCDEGGRNMKGIERLRKKRKGRLQTAYRWTLYFEMAPVEVWGRGLGG